MADCKCRNRRLTGLWRLFTLAGAMFCLPVNMVAQTADSPRHQLVAADTCMAMTLNVEQLLKMVDWTDEQITACEKDLSSDGFPLKDLQRVSVFVSSSVTGRYRYELPMAVVFQFGEKIDKLKLVSSANEMSLWKLARVEDSEHELFVAGNQEAIAMPRSAILFPSDRTYVTGSEGIVNQMLDGKSDGSSAGAVLVGKLDPTLAFHLVFEDGGRLLELPLFSDRGLIDLPAMLDPSIPGFHNLLASVEKVELAVNLESMVPVRATLSMANDKTAEDVEQLLNAAVLLGPGMFDELKSTMDPTDPDAQMFGEVAELIDFGKTALVEMQIDRNEHTVDIQLANIEGLEKLPGWIFKFFAIARQNRGSPEMFQELEFENAMDDIDDHE